MLKNKEVDPVRSRGTLQALATSNGMDKKQLDEVGLKLAEQKKIV